MNHVKIGKFIATLRKEKGLTQKKLAEFLGLSEKTISKWECGLGLPEVVYMESLCRALGITVNELLVGEHISIVELFETIEKSRLELMEQLEFEQLKMRLYKLYGFEIDQMKPTENGAGSLAYIVSSGKEKYVVKYAIDNEMNHPENEPRLCEFLIHKGVPACDFLGNRKGNKLSIDENGRRFHVQRFIEGVTYEYYQVPYDLQKKSARMLARIHLVMKDVEKLPVGIGEDFFKYRSPENMNSYYENTLKDAIEKDDGNIVERIRSNMEILSRFPDFKFDVKQFTCGNTHGDYMISQIIWSENEIAGVIDWTCACRHPFIWEIVRSYVMMAPECENGEINEDALLAYIKEYLTIGNLNPYDIENAGNLFYYFLAVCNFYEQYYESLTKNRYVYLQQADLAAALLVWFDKNIDGLNKKLQTLGEELRRI